MKGINTALSGRPYAAGNGKMYTSKGMGPSGIRKKEKRTLVKEKQCRITMNYGSWHKGVFVEIQQNKLNGELHE